MVSPLWTSTELATANKVDAQTDFSVSGTVHIDSRKVQQGDLFVAIEGPNNDGHSYIDQVMTAGAAGALVHKASTHPSVMVGETHEGLRQLAHASVQRSSAKRIAVTGSVGKTGTKELLAAGFGALGQTHATEGNLNNHFGLPLTLARMHRDTNFAILELGMDHAGEISHLTNIAKPHIAIITRIAKVHMAFFDKIDDIAEAKAEIFEGLVEGGIAILNQDDPFFALLKERAEAQGAKVLSFGTSADADAQLLSTTANPEGGQSVQASLVGKAIKFDLSMNGDHYGLSAMAVLLAGHVLGQDTPKMAKALADVKPLAGRGETTLLKNEILLIDETYNASPAAMNAAFAVLEHLAKARKTGRKVVILGDMLELGDEAPQMHADLGKTLVAMPVDVVYCCGSLMNHCKAFVQEHSDIRVEHFNDSTALAENMDRLIEEGDTVLVKGSLGSRMAAVCTAAKEKY